MYRILPVGLLLVSAAALHAQATYTYTGNPFTTAIGDLTTEDYLSISVTFPTPLAENQPLTDDSAEFSTLMISDGVNTTTFFPPIVNSQDRVLLATTDGAITAWDFHLFTNGGFDTSCGDVASACSTPTGDEATFKIPVDSGAQNTDDPGTWTLVAPEPSSAFLILSAGIPVFLYRVIKGSRRPRPQGIAA